MTRCSKCGSDSISAPRYERARFGDSEWLRYACITCGYSTTTPTRDAHEIRQREQEAIFRTYAREER